MIAGKPAKAAHPSYADAEQIPCVDQRLAGKRPKTSRIGRPAANSRSTSEAHPTWHELAQHFGDRVIADFRRAVAAQRAGSKPDMPVRLFLRFVARDPSAAAGELKKDLVEAAFYSEKFSEKSEVGTANEKANISLEGSKTSVITSKTDPKSSENWALGRVVAAIHLWQTTTLDSQHLESNTVEGYARLIAKTFKFLGALSDRRYPRFEQGMVSITTGTGRTASLGDSGWPELRDVEGAARERRALDLVRAEAMSEFQQAYALFQFGQRLMASEKPGPDIDAKAWQMVRDCLLREHQSWREHGHSFIDPRHGRLENPTALLSRLTDRTVWQRAGLDPRVAQRLFPSAFTNGRLRAFGAVLISCIGPSWMATTAAATVLCCDVGWNRQPILDLPRNPSIFSTSSEIAFASGVFISSFKRRAGHEVLAFLESKKIPSVLLSENLRSIWRTTAADLDPGSIGDGYSLLDRHSAAATLDLLASYTEMTDVIRKFDLKHRFADRFFFHLTGSRGCYGPAAS